MGCIWRTWQNIQRGREEQSKGIAKLALVLAALIALLMFVSHAAIVYLENEYHKQRRKEFEDATSIDPTTGAITRRTATVVHNGRAGPFRPGWFRYRIHYGRYGQSENDKRYIWSRRGDDILKNTVDTIKAQIRLEDKIFRWGAMNLS